MEKINVKIVNRGPHRLPQYSTALSAGMDLRAWLEEPLTLQPLERALVHTGIYIALPEGYECQIRPRSGLALKRGLTSSRGFSFVKHSNPFIISLIISRFSISYILSYNTYVKKATLSVALRIWF